MITVEKVVNEINELTRLGGISSGKAKKILGLLTQEDINESNALGMSTANFVDMVLDLFVG
jgi:hypothetical protein